MNNKPNQTNLLVIEEQELFREIYQARWATSSKIKIKGILPGITSSSLAGEVNRTVPDVLLIGAKRIGSRLFGELEELKNNAYGLGLVFLLSDLNQVDIDRLRQIVINGPKGFALFNKQSIESTRHLENTILAVADGQVLLDPMLASRLFEGKTENSFLQQLTAREREILNLLSQGLTNSAIAEALFIDIKTVEHHLNSLYGKLKADPSFSSRHLRVSAARLYYENAAGVTDKKRGVLVAVN